MLDRDFPPDIRNVNIVDPVAHWNNLGRSVSRKGVATVAEAFVVGRRRWRAVLVAAATNAGEGGSGGAAAAVASMFPLTVSWYGRGDGWREDELVHPLAGGGAAERASRLSGTLLPATPVPQPALAGGRGAAVAEVALTGDATRLNFALSYAQTVLWPLITPALLVLLSVQLLAARGPMAVGELGKCLAEATGNGRLPATLKDRFTGLKRFLEAHPAFFALGSEHQFNPTVSVQPACLPLVPITSGAMPLLDDGAAATP